MPAPETPPNTKTALKKKKAILIFLFVLMNIAVIVATATSEFGNSDSAAKLTEINLNGWLLIPALICFIVATIANVYKYVIGIRDAYAPKERPSRREIWKQAWRMVMLGKYYDNITPAAVGGQPFQIYYMYKNTNLPHGKAAAIPIVGMITTQVGFLIVAIVSFLCGGITADYPALTVMAWIGLLVYAFLPAMVIGITYFPKATIRVLNFLVKILAKLHIVKNQKTALEKVESEVLEYANAVKIILKTRGMLTKIILLSVVYNALIAAIPFFVLLAFGGNIGFWECFVTTVAVTSAVYVVPTPGNSGAAEGTFFLVFSALSSGYIFWAMLVWRFFSYYVYILVGLEIYLEMHFEKKRIARKQKS